MLSSFGEIALAPLDVGQTQLRRSADVACKLCWPIGVPRAVVGNQVMCSSLRTCPHLRPRLSATGPPLAISCS